MATGAFGKRAVMVGTKSGICYAKLRGFNASSKGTVVNRVSLDTPLNKLSTFLTTGSRFNGFDYRQISQLVKSNSKRAFLVDTLALAKRLEAQGMPSKQAEALTATINEGLNDTWENMAQNLVSKAEMQKIEVVLDSNLSKFKSQIQSSQEHSFSLLQRENEKLQSDIEKMHSEIRYEIDKANAGQRLDLNLERGRIRDELAHQNAETTNLTHKLDREIHALRTLLEAAKYDVIKYCIGTLVSISAIGLAVVRVLM